MKLNRCIMLVLAGASWLGAFAWGQKGHDVTAEIATRHLTPVTAAAIDSLFEGRSLVYWANWLDNASHQKAMAYTKTWHYKNIDDGVRYEEAPANPAGDAVTALRQQVELLTGTGEDTPIESDSRLALKIIVHVMGDMHQPLHLGHATDLGGNRIKVKYFGQEKNLHSVWDNSLPESAHRWSYTEWADQLDRLPAEAQAEAIAGGFDSWAKESAGIVADVYRAFPPGARVSYNEVARWTPVIEDRFVKGGLRLAHVLNLIFDLDYRQAYCSSMICK